MVIKVAMRFFNQNYTNFHSYYHRLLPPIKRAVKVFLVFYLLELDEVSYDFGFIFFRMCLLSFLVLVYLSYSC